MGKHISTTKSYFLVRTYALSVICIQIAVSIVLGSMAIMPEPTHVTRISDTSSVQWELNDLTEAPIIAAVMTDTHPEAA